MISFFWGDPSALVEPAKSGGAAVLHTIDSAAKAKRAVRCGVDVVVSQGREVGGHVCGIVASLVLIPAVADAVGDTPVVAAGGIADGRGLTAAMALGASGAWIGTRFLASEEASIHPHHRERLLQASENDTDLFADLFEPGWPDAPHRVMHHRTVADWKAAGCPPPGQRPWRRRGIATSRSRGPVVRMRRSRPDRMSRVMLTRFRCGLGRAWGWCGRCRGGRDCS